MRRLLKDVSAVLACTVESAKTLVPASTAHALQTTPELAVSMNSTLAKLAFARMEQRVLTMAKVIRAFVRLGSRERTVTKTLWTAKKTLAHHQRLVSIYRDDSTVSVLLISLEMIVENVRNIMLLLIAVVCCYIY